MPLRADLYEDDLGSFSLEEWLWVTLMRIVIMSVSLDIP